MTVAVASSGDIVLLGACPVDDAEPLLSLLLAHPEAVVDWTGCNRAHTAIIQLLMAARRELRGPCGDPFLNRWVEPLIS